MAEEEVPGSQEEEVEEELKNPQSENICERSSFMRFNPFFGLWFMWWDPFLPLTILEDFYLSKRKEMRNNISKLEA